MVNNYTYLQLYLDDLDRAINLNQFQTRFKIPHQTIKRHLESLVKNKILIKERMGKFLFYKINNENPVIFETLAICEKERLFEFLKNPLFSRLYSFLSPHFKDSSILIFGSSIEKKDFEDIDVLIISKKRINVKSFETTYTIKLHTITTTEKNLSRSFINEVRKKHIILNNHDYFIRLIYGKS